MAGSFAQLRTQWLTGGVHLLIILIAAQINEARVWPFALAAMSAVSFCAWIGNYRRYREIEDLPMSKIASAAQGYVELLGHSLPIADNPVIAPCSHIPCCWYRYCIESRDNDNKWKQYDSGESVAHFLLDDGTGQCVVSPDGAEVLYSRKNTWIEADQRYTEWLLLPKATLYALGEFRTIGGATFELDDNNDIANLLADWKKDEKKLLERFDTDRNGQIDLQEWERARQAARDEIEKEHAELRASGDVNLLCKPEDGRPFLLAAAVPARLGRHYAIWSGVHLAVFFAAGGTAFVMVTRHLA